MADAYKTQTKSKGRLVLKNDQNYKKKKKKEKKRLEKALDPEAYKAKKLAKKQSKRSDCAEKEIAYQEDPLFLEDQRLHHGWWYVKNCDEIKGDIIFEFDMHEFCYIQSIDDGTFTLGQRTIEQNPLPQEIISCICIDNINGNKFAFKTGFNRFLTCDKDNVIRGISEAYGPAETFEMIFQDGKMAIQACNGNFLTLDSHETLVAVGSTAGPEHMIKIRCDRDKSLEVKMGQLDQLPKEEHGSLAEAERNYARKFQAWVGGTLRLNPMDERDLVKAREKGSLHSELLSRRSVMKNDKYCK